MQSNVSDMCQLVSIQHITRTMQGRCPPPEPLHFLAFVRVSRFEKLYTFFTISECKIAVGQLRPTRRKRPPEERAGRPDYEGSCAHVHRFFRSKGHNELAASARDVTSFLQVILHPFRRGVIMLTMATRRFLLPAFALSTLSLSTVRVI